MAKLVKLDMGDVLVEGTNVQCVVTLDCDERRTVWQVLCNGKSTPFADKRSALDYAKKVADGKV